MNKGRRAGRGSGWGKGCRMGQAGGRGARRPRYGRRPDHSSPPSGFAVFTIEKSGEEISTFKDKVKGMVHELRSISARIPGPSKISPLTPIVHKERCVSCGICAAVCPENAISMNDEPVIDSDRCNGCGSCIKACPNEAISLSGLKKAEAL